MGFSVFLDGNDAFCFCHEFQGGVDWSPDDADFPCVILFEENESLFSAFGGFQEELEGAALWLANGDKEFP